MARQILNQEGFAGLFKGLELQVLHVIPYAVLTFSLHHLAANSCGVEAGRKRIAASGTSVETLVLSYAISSDSTIAQYDTGFIYHYRLCTR
jgi:hypothetical protein